MTERNYGFVNESVLADSEEARRYNLDAIMKRFGRQPVREYFLTIDRQRDAALFMANSGREEFFNDTQFVLWYGDTPAFVFLQGFEGSIPGKSKLWRLLSNLTSLQLPEDYPVTRSTFEATLKDALRTFKLFGLPKDQHRDFAIEFAF